MEILELNVFILCTLLTACIYIQSSGSHKLVNSVFAAGV